MISMLAVNEGPLLRGTVASSDSARNLNVELVFRFRILVICASIVCFSMR
jgi:hypothetical protein